jgi:hypothetical protein
MKERYARLNLSLLPADIKKEFEEINELTSGFSDDDVNAEFTANFDMLYEIVESKFPDAIKKGGTVKKVKPAKVKKVSPKGRVLDTKPLTPEAKEEYHKKIGRMKKLDADDIEFIESTLSNDEESSDEELVDHFVDQLGITKAAAQKWVKQRDRILTQSVEESLSYSVRTAMKKEKRSGANIVKTRDGYSFDRKDPKMKGLKFYDENGKQWTCKGYNKELDECIMKDSDGKEIATCVRDMYVHNPVEKREKGNLVDDCKETLKEAGYTVKEHKKGTKKVTRREPRPEKEIIKERVGDTFTPIKKDLTNSDEKKKENKEVIDALERVEKLFVKVFNRISNLADDNRADAIAKIEKLLKELLGE